MAADDLVAFITARLDEDEATALDALHPDAVSPGVWMTEHHGDDPPTCHIAEDRAGHYWSVAHDVFVPNAEHIARHDPARVLREVAAKRRILAAAAEYSPELEHGDNGEWAFDLVVRELAAAWSDHPDYRAEWCQEMS
jgi:hypothetical protein